MVYPILHIYKYTALQNWRKNFINLYISNFVEIKSDWFCLTKNNPAEYRKICSMLSFVVSLIYPYFMDGNPV